MNEQTKSKDRKKESSNEYKEIKSPVALMKATTKKMLADPTTIKGFETAPQMGFLKTISVKKGVMAKRIRSFLPLIGTLIPMFREIKKTTKSLNKNPKNPKTNTDELFIDKLLAYTKELGIIIGFTKLRKELIFREEAVYFDNVIVLSMEMNKEKIDRAPSKETEKMIIETYHALGIATNKIADFLRQNGYSSQSCHPLGGAICYPPLIGDAGMGWYGRHGLAIIPEYGPRHRVAAVLTSIENLPIKNGNEYKWIEEYCRTCGRCIKKCPAKAIYKTAILNDDKTKTHIDDKRCFPEFSSNYGCSVCVKECMFNKLGYKKIKSITK